MANDNNSGNSNPSPKMSFADAVKNRMSPSELGEEASEPDQAFAEGGIAQPMDGGSMGYNMGQQQQLPPLMEPRPPGMDELIAGVMPTSVTASGMRPPGMDEFIAPEMLQAQYGTVGQQALAGLEGAAQGILGPLAPAFETKVLGVDPTDIRKRAEANPVTSIGSEVLGFVGPAVATAGASALGSSAAKGVNAAAKFTQAGLLAQTGRTIDAVTGKFIQNQLTKDVIREAFTAGLYQAGAEASQMFREDPEQSASAAISDVGLAMAIGGPAGGLLSAAFRKLAPGVKPLAGETPFISNLDAPSIEAGELPALIKTYPGFANKERESILDALKNLGREKSNAPELRKIATKNNLPLYEGMVSDNTLVQRGEDTLLTGGMTYSAMKRQNLYDDAYRKMETITDGALGENSQLSTAEVGQKLQEALVSKIKEDNAPIAQMYAALKQKHSSIPLDKVGAKSAKEELLEMAEFRISPSSPQGQLAKRIMADLDNVRDVDDLQILKSSIHDSLAATASPGERRIAAILSDKLKTLQNSSIERFAVAAAGTPEEAALARALPAAKLAADNLYIPEIRKIEQLAERLGKSRIQGPADAINFIKNLDYEQVTQRLFNKNKSEFLTFFAKEFPEQMQLVRDYQKGVLRRSSMLTTGEFSTRKLFTSVKGLQPEIQRAIFNAEELAAIKEMDIYLSSFPKRFNPSGTDGAKNFRDSFTPGKRAMSEAHDLLTEKFIKNFGASPEAADARMLGVATAKGIKMTDRAVKVIMTGTKIMPAAMLPIASHKDKLARLIAGYENNPDSLLDVGDEIPVPEYATAFAATASRVLHYLNSVRPDTDPKAPLDTRHIANSSDRAKYDNALSIAQQPLVVLDKIARGTLTANDVQAIKAMYPSFYEGVKLKLVEGIMEKQQKKELIPYRTKMQLSLFLAQPLDSSMTPAGIQGAQMIAGPSGAGAQGPQQGGGSPAGGKKLTAASANGLNKLSKTYQTQMQARQSSKIGRK